MTNFVFGLLIGLFIVAVLAVVGLVLLEWMFSQAGALTPPFA